MERRSDLISHFLNGKVSSGLTYILDDVKEEP